MHGYSFFVLQLPTYQQDSCSVLDCSGNKNGFLMTVEELNKLKDMLLQSRGTVSMSDFVSEGQ